MADLGPQTEAVASSTAPAASLRLAVLLNSGGGTVLREGEVTLEARLARAFEGQGAQAAIRFLHGGELREAAVRALIAVREGELDGVVVGGGDGSVSTVADVLARSGVPMGVLPLGTLNHFAKDLGMPADPAEAAAAIARGRVRAVDVGEANGRVFVNNSILGVYPMMVLDRERRRREHGLGKWPAMCLAFLRMLIQFPRRRVTLCTAAGNRPYRTPCLFIGNNPYDMRNLELRRREGLDNGILWVLVARHGHWRSFLRFAAKIAFKGISPEKDLDTFNLKEFEIRPKAHRVTVAFDGEVARVRGPIRYRSLPGALTVYAPA